VIAPLKHLNYQRAIALNERTAIAAVNPSKTKLRSPNHLKRPVKIWAIGGNVNNSVSMKTLKKVDAQGKLTNAPPNWFVVIKNLL